ncbi:hypothetical protein SOVF_161810 [Spinacia oleracea]|nr:hypothetical protein SOVF_161810 [Spinacia oleracea]
MAEGVVFNIVERLLESLGEHALQEIASCWGARGDLRKLGNSVRMIKARVRDAEKRGEEEDNDAIKEWLKRLRLVLHQAEVLTIDLQNKRVEGNNKLVKKVRVLFSRDCSIECLPDAITRLENLQTLYLDGCRRLKRLPRDFTRLAKLRHLLMCREILTDLPSRFGKMTSLQELSGFIVGESTGIDSLPALNLKGILDIKFRKWRSDAVSEAQKASLKENQQLTFLYLDLSFSDEII